MKSIRLLAIIEAATITGPAKNLLQFAAMARGEGFDRRVEVSIAVFQRPGQPELFLETARQSSLPVYPIAEKGRFDLAVIDGLLALGKQLQPDLVQSHAVKSHFLVRKSWDWREWSPGSRFITATPGRTCERVCTINWTAGRCAPQSRC